MKVVIVRGPSLCPWEMQTYEPLRFKVKLLSVGSKHGRYDLSRCSLPIKRLFCAGEYLGFVPFGIRACYKILGDPQYLIGFDSIVKYFDIVHAAELGSYYSLQAIKAKRRGLVKAVTLTVFENIPFLGDENTVRKKLKKEVKQGVDHFLAASRLTKEALIKEGVADKKISIIGQGIDTQRFRPRENKESGKINNKLKKQLELNKDDFVILSVGRMVKEKGFQDLIEAAAKINSQLLSEPDGSPSRWPIPNYQTNRKIKFLLLGEGPERKNLESKVKKLGIEDTVRFTGGISYDRMPGVFRMADLFVLASRPTAIWNEQFGFVLIEAMATGLPIVASNSGAIGEVVPKPGGFLIPPHNAARLAEAIEKIYLDNETRVEMGKYNRRYAVGNYDAKLIAEKIYKIWKGVLKNKTNL